MTPLPGVMGVVWKEELDRYGLTVVPRRLIDTAIDHAYERREDEVLRLPYRRLSTLERLAFRWLIARGCVFDHHGLRRELDR